MIDFIIVEDNGEILINGSCPKDQLQYQKIEGCTTIKAKADHSEDYYDFNKGAVKKKLVNPSYLEVTEIKSVPDPSTVTLYDGSANSVEVTDGEVKLDADVPGTYRVVVDSADPKYYTAEFEVNL